VLRELQSDQSLSQAERESALRIAHLRGDDPLPLLARSVDDCIDPDQSPTVFDQALERAAAADEMRSNLAGMEEWEIEALVNLAQGVASYRTALYAEAEKYLAEAPRETRDDQRTGFKAPGHGQFGQREHALRLLFLCMAQCKSSHRREAERSWRLAQQKVLNDVELSQRAELQGLLAEVETVLRSSTPPAGS
jgi:hypothetical protein